MEKKKVLFLMPSMTKGGAEKVLINLLQKIDKSKYDIDLCVVLRTGFYLNRIPEEIHTIYLLKSVLLGRIFTYLQIKFNINLFYRFLVNKNLKTKYDVAISYTDSSYTDLITFLPKKPGKTISWIHASYSTYSNYSKGYTESYKRRISKNRYNKMDTLVFVSQDSMDSFASIFGRFKDMRVIYNVFNIEEVINNANIDKPELSQKVNIVAMGSLLPVKGYDMLIDACKLLKQDDVDFHLTILGDGPLKSKLQQLIDNFHLSEDITLKGFIENPYPYLKASDIYVMSSLSEALPTALCEAMILGKPVVVTDCTGCREIVDYGAYGVMVEKTAESISKGLKLLLINYEERYKYSTLSLERASDFSDEQILEDIDVVLN